MLRSGDSIAYSVSVTTLCLFGSDIFFFLSFTKAKLSTSVTATYRGTPADNKFLSFFGYIEQGRETKLKETMKRNIDWVSRRGFKDMKGGKKNCGYRSSLSFLTHQTVLRCSRCEATTL